LDEAIPTGFAQSKDWEMMLNATTFLQVTSIPRQGDPQQFRLSSPGPEDVLRKLELEQLSFDSPDRGAVAYSNDTVSPELDGPASGGPSSDPSPIDAAMEELLTVCQNAHRAVDSDSDANRSPERARGLSVLRQRLSFTAPRQDKKKVIYVHCKTGLSRSYVFAMCYLVSQRGLGLHEADQYLRSLRQFAPRPVHVAMVERFHQYIKNPRFQEKSAEEERYVRVLADVLSLPPKYRHRLLQDMDKLT
jgi:hypothetical protein